METRIISDLFLVSIMNTNYTRQSARQEWDEWAESASSLKKKISRWLR